MNGSDALTIRLGPATGCNAESRGHLTQGQPKPEVTMPATKVVIPALKLACHAGISWENIDDYDAFTAAVRTELQEDRGPGERAVVGRRSFSGDLHPALAPNGERIDDLERSAPASVS